jgi:hypothetical protein
VTEASFAKVLEKRQRILGDEHPDTISALNTLASMLGDQGKLAEAEARKREELQKMQRIPRRRSSNHGIGHEQSCQTHWAIRESWTRGRRCLGRRSRSYSGASIRPRRQRDRVKTIAVDIVSKRMHFFPS